MQTDLRLVLQGRRILVVEDEFLLAMELERVLRAQGCTVVGPAPTSARALALIERERVDACLLDVNLSGTLATPVAEALAARSVPFVLVTGYSERRIPVQELRDVPRVGKPVDDRELLRILATILASA